MKQREVAAFVCKHVLEHSRPVLLVARDDGDWQFLCGEAHEPEEIPEVVGMNHIIDSDPGLRQILDLPAGWLAERSSPDLPWVRTMSEPDK